MRPYGLAKRLLDITITVPLFLLLTPLQIVLAALVRCNIGAPILFTQERAGLHGQPFYLRKYRTMTVPAYKDQPDIERMTRMGNFLRSTSLDELPSLWNVIKGDMSLVGPRPLLLSYMPLYSREQARRHEVRPGITGLAQVSGRNAITWAERFRLDNEYVQNRSLALDIRILCRTIGTVATREGIAAEGSATMPRFAGNGESDAPRR